MFKLNRITAAAATIVSAFAASPFATAAEQSAALQASCGSASAEAIQGGYVVSRYCDGRRFRGVGSTLDDAVANVNAMVSLVPYDVKCTYSSVAGGPGAFIAEFACSKISEEGGPINIFGNLGGIGTTLTDAGNNAFGFAQLYAVSGGYKCRPTETVAVPGGYITNFGCSYPNPDGPIGQSSRISGVGSTSTDSGQNNLGFAELAAVDVRCSTSASSIKVVGLAFEVRFSCNGSRKVGFGSTLTSAGRDALLQAQTP